MLCPENRDQVALSWVPCPPGTEKGPGKACPVAVVLGPWPKLPLCPRIWGWAEMRWDEGDVGMSQIL